MPYIMCLFAENYFEIIFSCTLLITPNVCLTSFITKCHVKFCHELKIVASLGGFIVKYLPADKTSHTKQLIV